MLVMRPAQLSDLAEVQRLAAISPVGVTSLPDSADRLREKILASEASFAAEVAFNGEETYFFVLEDTERGGLVGCSGLVASAGYTEPFYSFRNETFVHVSRELNIHNKTHALSLCHDLTGNSLLDSFFVEADKAAPPVDELISRGRLLFVADHPERFADSMVVDILGISDVEGDSPFWDGVGRHFFGMSYAEAEHLSGVKSRSFLAELMPHYPIYVPLLSDEAQEAMGEVNPDAQASFDILTREGFETEHYIDIFDGGPTLHARTSAIRSIVHSQLLAVQLSDAPVTQGGRTWLIANGLLQDFRALLVELDWEPGMPLCLDRTTAEALGVGEGSSVRLVAL
ncbi:MAG TPA: arginine/ornithine succinyltransferase subunit alpha [Pseudomonas sp.]|jgi:arginine N-succinyltransferase|nr:arginine/ornithine succinyltransferase subunit alpha [Pseudomonas sp.]